MHVPVPRYPSVLSRVCKVVGVDLSGLGRFRDTAPGRILYPPWEINKYNYIYIYIVFIIIIVFLFVYIKPKRILNILFLLRF